MNSCARVLISKILLPSPVNEGMMGLVRPAPPPAAAAPPGSAISSKSEEASSTSSSESLSELSSAPSPYATSSDDSSSCRRCLWCRPHLCRIRCCLRCHCSLAGA